MSVHDWPGRDHYFEVCCDRDCGTLLSEVATLKQAFAAMIENHDECRPTVATITRRGRTPAKKRWCWTVWLHCGPHIDRLKRHENTGS